MSVAARSQNPDRHRPANAGFLLVEILAVMAISAFLLVALASTVSLLLRASDRTTRVGRELEDTSQVVAALAREIATIEPYRWAGADAGFVFAGSPVRLMFATKDNGAGTRIVVFENTGRGDRTTMIRAEAPLAPTATGPDALAGAEALQLYGGRYSVRFAYFAPLEDGSEALLDTWDRATEMPVAVRVSMIAPDGIVAASLRVGLRVDAEPGCSAPGIGVCRHFKRIESNDTDEDNQPPDAAIDPDDALGWMRYVQ